MDKIAHKLPPKPLRPRPIGGEGAEGTKKEIPGILRLRTVPSSLLSCLLPEGAARRRVHFCGMLLALVLSMAAGGTAWGQQNPTLILVPPKLEAWVAPLQASADRSYPRYFRVESGWSVNQAKDWTFAVQLGVGRQGPRRGGGLGGGVGARTVHVPFSVHYWANGKPATILREGIAGACGETVEEAEQRFLFVGVISLRMEMAAMLAERLFVDEPKPEILPYDPVSQNRVYVMAQLDKRPDPPTASWKLHNRLPVAVRVAFELPGSQGFVSYRVPATDGENVELVPLILQPQEERTMTIPLTGLDPRQASMRVILVDLELLDP
jgi:hypothetical protein